MELLGGFFLVVTQICGDWKWIKETLQVASYHAGSFCYKCFATKCLGPLNAWFFDDDAAWTLATRNNTTFMRHLADLDSCFFLLVGMHLDIIMADLLHICMLGFLHK